MAQSAVVLMILATTLVMALGQLEKFPPSVHSCVHATRKLAKRGDGSTRQSCMGCDPTYPTCADNCQPLIDKIYLRCDGICLPNGYFFDPQWEQKGCWDDVKSELKIKVERCGCSSAPNSRASTSLAVIVVAVLAWIHH